MIWHVELDNSVRKVLQRIPHKDADRIREVFRDFPQDPFEGDIVKLSGEENSWRRRVGSYRIFFEIFTEQHVILIQELQCRGSKTY